MLSTDIARSVGVNAQSLRWGDRRTGAARLAASSGGSVSSLLIKKQVCSASFPVLENRG